MPQGRPVSSSPQVGVCAQGTARTPFLQEARPFPTAEALPRGTARTELAPGPEVPLLTGHRCRENY